MRGARAVQKKVPELNIEDLKVYVVWMPMLPSDAREHCDTEDIHLENSTYFWNKNRQVGKWFTDNLPDFKPLGAVAWDAYYLYGPEAKWEQRLPGPRGYATPIFTDTDGLVQSLRDLTKEK